MNEEAEVEIARQTTEYESRRRTHQTLRLHHSRNSCRHDLPNVTAFPGSYAKAYTSQFALSLPDCRPGWITSFLGYTAGSHREFREAAQRKAPAPAKRVR